MNNTNNKLIITFILVTLINRPQYFINYSDYFQLYTMVRNFVYYNTVLVINNGRLLYCLNCD